MVKIKTSGDLEAWLATRPRDDAVLIAARAALRVFPLTLGALSDTSRFVRAAVILPVFRALAAACFAGAWHKQAANIVAVRAAVARAATVIAAAAARADTDRLVARDAARSSAAPDNAEDRAVFVAARAAAYDVAGAAIDSAYAAVRATTATDAVADAVAVLDAHPVSDATRDAFAAIQADANALLAGSDHRTVASLRLWHGDPPVWAAQHWAGMQEHLAGDMDERWWVWTGWMNGHLLGQPANRDLQRGIVNLADEDWTAGPARVNARIAGLMAKYPGTPAIDRPGGGAPERGAIDGDARNPSRLPG